MEKRNIVALIVVLAVGFSFCVYATVPARAQQGAARIVRTSAVSNVGGPYPVYVQVDFYNYWSDTLWVGLSFRTHDGKIIDYPPQDVTRQGKGYGFTVFVCYLDELPTTDGDILGRFYNWQGLEYAVGLWKGFDGRYMTGFIDRTSWQRVGGL